MGTFHDGKHKWHGITVVVDTAGAEIYLGRLDDMDADRVILRGADVHVEATGGPTKDEYVARAAKVGIWEKHRTLVLPRADVTSVRPLGELAGD